MGAVLPLDPPNVNEPQVDLVDECGGLERVVRALARHVPSGNAPQLLVHDRQQFLERLTAAVSPFDQKRRHLSGPAIRHERAHSTPPRHDSCSLPIAPPSPTGGLGPPGGTTCEAGFGQFLRHFSSQREWPVSTPRPSGPPRISRSALSFSRSSNGCGSCRRRSGASAADSRPEPASVSGCSWRSGRSTHCLCTPAVCSRIPPAIWCSRRSFYDRASTSRS